MGETATPDSDRGRDHDDGDDLAYGGVCPVCGDEFTDGFDDIDEDESIEGVRLCVIKKDEDGTGTALYHLPEDQEGDDGE